MQLRKEFGPGGGRNLAARLYNVAYRYFSSSWDWAAASLGMDAPNPLLSAPADPPKQKKGNLLAARKPPPPSFNNTASVVSLCGAPSNPPPLDPSTSVSNPRPRAAPLTKAGGGYSKSHPSVKTPLKSEGLSSMTESGTAPPPISKGGIRALIEQGASASFPRGVYG